MNLVLLPLPAKDQEAAPLFPQMVGAEGSAAWFSALAGLTLAEGEEAFVATLQGRAGIVAAIPLVHTGRGGIRALTAPYSTTFGPAALTGADAFALGSMLAKLVNRRLDLDSLDMQLPLNRAFLEGLSQSGLVTASYRHFANWHEDIDSFDTFWASRPARLRETVRRKSRKLGDAGGTFALLSAPDDIGRGIEAYREVYADSGKVAEPHPGIMPRLIESLAARGNVQLGLVRLKEETAAVQLWLTQGDDATIFKLAHRKKFSSWSPGTLLTHWMFSQLIPLLHIRRINFGRGDDPYKRDWLRVRTFRRGIIACNPTNLAGLRDIATDIFPTWAGLTWRRLAGEP